MSDRRVFAIVFDDADVGPQIVIGEQVARAAFERVSLSWNAHLFVKLASNSRDNPRANDNATLADDAAQQRVAVLEADAERLDNLERCIRDGSWPSILNDIVAICQHSYGTFGNGPALRTAIDLSFPRAALASTEPTERMG